MMILTLSCNIVPGSCGLQYQLTCIMLLVPKHMVWICYIGTKSKMIGNYINGKGLSNILQIISKKTEAEDLISIKWEMRFLLL